MKVTVIIEPEEVNEGDWGAEVVVTKENVVSLYQLMTVYTQATKGADFFVDDVYAVLNGTYYGGRDELLSGS